MVFSEYVKQRILHFHSNGLRPQTAHAHAGSEVPSLALNAWYLDDGTLVGPSEGLSAALDIIERDGPPLGLHLNRAKSLLFVPSQCDSSQSSLPPDIPVTSEGFCLLGCPIGPPSYCEEIVQARITRIREFLAALHDMQDSQLETTLLRSCLALPKFSYILRTSPPSYIEQATRDFDVAVRETLEVILGGPLSEWSGPKASLPSSRGGTNLRSASLQCPGSLSGLLLLLPGVDWENARTSSQSLPPRRVCCCCPRHFHLTTRLAASLPLTCHR